MKQTVLCAVLAFGLLAGCTREPATESAAAETPPETAAAAAESRPDGPAGGALTRLTNNNATGLYEAVVVQDDAMPVWPILITKVDYAAAEQRVLCAAPGCTHSDASCPARLPEGAIGASCFAVEGGVLVFYSLEDTASYELLGDCLAFYPDDGGGAQLLAENRSFHPVATDGENLYCEFYDIGADPAAEIPIRLYKLPLGGGEGELLASDYPGSGLGCVGREILSQDMGAGAVNAYNIDTGETRKLAGLTMGDYAATGCALAGGRLYTIAPDSIPGDIAWVDVATGETGTLEVDWPIAPEGACTVTLRAVGGKIVADVWDIGALAGTLVAIDPADGAAAAIPLHAVLNGHESSLQILGETADDLYVWYGERWENRTIPGKDGQPTPVERAVPLTALLSKDDFFAGNPNYREVTTMPSAF